MVVEVLNRFIQTEIDYGEIFLLSRHMSQFCQPFFSGGKSCGMHEVYFKDPYHLIL